MKNNHKAYIYLIITFWAWGSLHAVNKFLLDNVSVFVILFSRYLLASIFSAFVLMVNLHKKKNGLDGVDKTQLSIEKKDIKYVLLISISGYFLAVLLQLLGTKYSNVSLSSLINSLNPLFIIIMAAVILKEKITKNKILCIILALVGTLIISNGVDTSKMTGIIFSGMAAVFWAISTVIVRKTSYKYDTSIITFYSMIIAGVLMLPGAIYEIMNKDIKSIDITVIIGLIYIGIVSTGIANLLWNKSLSLMESGKCSLFYPLQPLIATILGCAFLGEKVTIKFIVGAIIIVSGVVFSTQDKS